MVAGLVICDRSGLRFATGMAMLVSSSAAALLFQTFQHAHQAGPLPFCYSATPCDSCEQCEIASVSPGAMAVRACCLPDQT